MRWQGRMADDVAATRAMVAKAQRLLESVPRNFPGQSRDADGQFASGGGGGGSDDDEDLGAPLVDPAVIGGVKVNADIHVRAVDDPDGLLSENGEPGKYVAVTENARDGADEGIFYAPAQARAIADQVDAVADQARKATPPPHPADLDAPRPPAYEDGPAMLAHGTAAGHPVSAYHDAYDDMGGADRGGLLVVGPQGGQPTWDLSGHESGLSMDLDDAGAFASALRDMASAAEGA